MPRCTTELTARFNLAPNLIGSQEIEDFFNTREYTYFEDFDDYGLPQPSRDIIDAMDKEELIAIDREDDPICEHGLNDALDFDTVPFEKVEAQLSVELFEQDLAEDRANDYGNEDFDPFNERYDAQSYETWEQMKKRHANARLRREKVGAALLRAKELYPQMNWSALIGLHNAGHDVLKMRPGN